MEWSRNFEARPDSVRAARRLVASVVHETGADVEFAELLTSELATNAVVHAVTRFEARIRTAHSGVRVEIVNDEPELLASLRDPDERGGRGLGTIEALASRWGTESIGSTRSSGSSWRPTEPSAANRRRRSARQGQRAIQTPGSDVVELFGQVSDVRRRVPHAV